MKRVGCVVSLAVLLVAAAPILAQISASNIRFIDYPDFPDAHSTWGSIGYSTVHNRVFIGVTNHRDRVGLFEYDVKAGSMRLCGFVPELAHLREFQWQGKIHTQIVEGPACGEVYFATDGGESREEYLMEHPQGYGGGFLMKWNPAENRLTNLGVPLQYESIKPLVVRFPFPAWATRKSEVAEAAAADPFAGFRER